VAVEETVCKWQDKGRKKNLVGAETELDTGRVHPGVGSGRMQTFPLDRVVPISKSNSRFASSLWTGPCGNSAFERRYHLFQLHPWLQRLLGFAHFDPPAVRIPATNTVTTHPPPRGPFCVVCHRCSISCNRIFAKFELYGTKSALT